MKTLRLDYPVRLMCRVFDVSPSGFYAWLKRPPSRHAYDETRLEVEIRAAHHRTRETYGPERLQQDLAEYGVQVGVHRIKRIRKKLGLRCKQKRKFQATTDSQHGLPVADNLLDQDFTTARAPNEVWLSDLTYIPTGEGWLYLVGHKDLFTGEIVGYAMGERMTTALVSQSLWRAVSTQRPGPGLIHHSDRGRQDCAYAYRELLEQFGFQASMSRKANCWDNAPMESLWGALKNELVHHRRYATRQEAIADITEWIELFYNRQRRQARLGYRSPAAYAQQFYRNRRAA
jgi:putative transposase